LEVIEKLGSEFLVPRTTTCLCLKTLQKYHKNLNNPIFDFKTPFNLTKNKKSNQIKKKLDFDLLLSTWFKVKIAYIKLLLPG